MVFGILDGMQCSYGARTSRRDLVHSSNLLSNLQYSPMSSPMHPSLHAEVVHSEMPFKAYQKVGAPLRLDTNISNCVSHVILS